MWSCRTLQYGGECLQSSIVTQYGKTIVHIMDYCIYSGGVNGLYRGDSGLLCTSCMLSLATVPISLSL